jgi:hypothetical protein
MRRLVVGVVVAGFVLAGCGSSSSSSEPSTSRSVAPPTVASSPPVAVTAEPAGPNPSAAAVMVCADEAQKDIAQILGVTATRVTTPTWVDHVYSCQYVYPNAAITLSVKELSTVAETKAYFDQLGQTLGRRPGSLELGQGAFHSTNGSIVVRKDYKVLEVDVSQVPERFGKVDLTPDLVALNVGEIIMGCWVGA